MPKQQSTSRYILTLLAVIFVATAFVLVGLNALRLEQKIGTTAKENYVKGYLAARTSYASMCSFSTQETNQLTGQVQSVGAASLTLVQQSLDTDPIVDGVSNVRTANVTSETVIQRTVQKSPEQIKKELAEYAKLKNPKSPPPSSVTYQNITLRDIKEGERVLVQSATNIRLLETFDASLIRVID